MMKKEKMASYLPYILTVAVILSFFFWVGAAIYAGGEAADGPRSTYTASETAWNTARED